MSDMIKVKTQDLSGAALDWAVAQIDEVRTVMLSVKSQEAKKPFALFGSLALPVGGGDEGYSPSSCWHCGGALIEKYKLDIGAPMENQSGSWIANTEWGPFNGYKGETPLIAACRAIVASVLGDTVSVPKELV